MNQISLKEKISYGSGDLACNTMFTAVSSFLRQHRTEKISCEDVVNVVK